MASEWISLASAFNLALDVEKDYDLTERLMLKLLWEGRISAVGQRAFVGEKLIDDLPIPTQADWFGWPELNPNIFDWTNSRAKSPHGSSRSNRSLPARTFERTEFYQVVIRSDQLQSVWPSIPNDGLAYSQRSEVDRSGAPGKPSSMHLVEWELDRREDAGERHPTIKEWSDVLSQWLAENHRGAPRATSKTISNALGHRFRGLLSAAPDLRRP